MASILGWKDILRPIRDGYRHMFPTPDTGPTPEERHRRREQDRRKGFTYFDTFEQLEAWHMDQSDPLQRANTPLLPRSRAKDCQRERGANILLCHDMSGNYHEYESMQEVAVTDEMYACEYLQYVDTFVYFSHKLVCVPPPVWTNQLHRNGVKALGTIILEPQAKNTGRLLQHIGEGSSARFGFAMKLASIAKHYGFDGWLVNIEKPFAKEDWHANILEAFLRQLREELGFGMQLVWYDALTIFNEVNYQNGLTVANLPFAEACGGILTNYKWDLRHAEDAKQVVSQSSINPENVYFGIDVWAQNRSGFGIPRTTFGKGGTTTGVAIAKLSEIGLSAGVFAPAWSFEHFPGHGRDVERTMWEGEALPDRLECSCGRATSRHHPVEGFCMATHAKVFPAGTDSFFYTDFTRAFGTHGEEEKRRLFDGQPLHAQVGAQSILPLPLLEADRDQRSCLRHRLEIRAGQTKLVIEAHNGPTEGYATALQSKCWLPLYKLDMPADGSRRIEVVCRNVMLGAGAMPSLYLKFSSAEGHQTRQPQELSIHETGEVCTITAQIGVPSDSGELVRLEELGIHLEGFSGEGTVPVAELSSISIVPLAYFGVSEASMIENIRLERRGQGENEHMRICWDYKVSHEMRHSGMPYSNTTGIFSHFALNFDGLQIGRAYAVEYLLSESLVKDLAGKEVEVEIVGIGFDGRALVRKATMLRIGTG